MPLKLSADSEDEERQCPGQFKNIQYDLPEPSEPPDKPTEQRNKPPSVELEGSQRPPK